MIDYSRIHSKKKSRKLQANDPTSKYVGHVKIHRRTPEMKRKMLDSKYCVQRLDSKIGAHHVEYWSLGMIDLTNAKEFFAYHYFDSGNGWCTEYIQLTKKED